MPRRNQLGRHRPVPQLWAAVNIHWQIVSGLRRRAPLSRHTHEAGIPAPQFEPLPDLLASPAKLDPWEREVAAAVSTDPWPDIDHRHDQIDLAQHVLGWVTPRQRQLLQALAAGERRCDVAAGWHISQPAVSQQLACARRRVADRIGRP